MKPTGKQIEQNLALSCAAFLPVFALCPWFNSSPKIHRFVQAHAQLPKYDNQIQGLH